MSMTSPQTMFDRWMSAVDGHVQIKLGVSVHDLPDMCFRDYYDDGMTPAQVAQIVMEENL